MSPNRWMRRAEHGRRERAPSASRTPSLGAAAMADASVVCTGSVETRGGRVGTSTHGSRGATTVRRSTALLAFDEDVPSAGAMLGPALDLRWRKV
jgi:hypothetical protein